MPKSPGVNRTSFKYGHSCLHLWPIRAFGLSRVRDTPQHLNAGSYPSHSNDEKQEICVDDGFVVKQADFSANGEVLCVLATGSSTTTTADHAYFYNTGVRPATVGGKGVYEKVSPADFAVRLELSATLNRQPKPLPLATSGHITA